MIDSPLASVRGGSSPNMAEKPRRARAESRLAVPREGLTRLESRRYPPCVPVRLSDEWRPWNRSLSFRFGQGADFHSPLSFSHRRRDGAASRSQTPNRREYR